MGTPLTCQRERAIDFGRDGAPLPSLLFPWVVIIHVTLSATPLTTCLQPEDVWDDGAILKVIRGPNIGPIRILGSRVGLLDYNVQHVLDPA